MKKAPKEILSQYKPADDSFIINAGDWTTNNYDPSLTPIRLSLPKPPPLHLIEGYGLEAKDQYFKRVMMPDKLVQLEKRVKRELELRSKENVNKRVNGYRILNAIWEELQSNREYYENEIEFIRTQWFHRLKGYFFFNNGKPTYITGTHYMYLNYWKIEGRLFPEYRDSNRKLFLWWKYLSETTETFKNLDKEGNAVPNEKGEFEMIDTPSRVFYGATVPKNRRTGMTNMCLCDMYEKTSRTIGDISAIFSTGKDSAEALFKDKIVKSWKNMPFFFLPTFDGVFDVSSEINFKRPRNIVIGEELNSRITFAQNAFGSELDSQRITYADFSESGKTKECDVEERWTVHKQSLGNGDGSSITGFCIHESTVEDMEAANGAIFESLVYDSNFYKRNHVTGQTKTGLATIFIPAYEGLENFVDKYGESIINKPTQQQIEGGFKFRHGSRTYLQSKRDELLNSKNPKDKIQYRRLIVKQPFLLDECFQLSSGSTSFNLDIINARLAELRRIKEPFVRGNFEWIGQRFGDVKFVADIEGRFEISKLLNPGESNQKVKTNGYDDLTGEYKESWMPKNPTKGTIGADVTKFKGDRQMAATTGGYQSDSGLAIYLEWDTNIDPLDKPIQDRLTDRFIGCYRSRVLSDVYYEDVIKAAIYYGFMIYPENNIDDLWVWIEKVGFGGYLLYDIEETTGKFKKKPGVYQSETSKEKMFKHFQNYIQYRGHMENHASLLTEISKLKQLEDLNKLDLAAAAGCALLGSNSRSRQLLETVDDYDNDIRDAWRAGKINW